MDLPHKIAIVLENQTAYPTSVHVMRQLKSVATPDYFAAGRDLSRRIWSNLLMKARCKTIIFS